MGKGSSPKRLIAIDTEDDGTGPMGLISVQVVGDGVAEYLRKDYADTYGDALRERARRFLEGLGPSEAWSCNAWYDALNLGMISVGVTARKTSHGYTEFRHQAIPGMVLLNTLSISPVSVAAMGDEVGLPKLPTDPYDRTYAMRDAEIVYRWILEVRRGLEELGGSLRPTSGATAGALWTGQGGQIPPLPSILKPAGRAAFRGGRVEVFRFGVQGAAQVWDISSAFPAAMVEAPFPWGGWTPSRDVDRPGLYDVEIDTRGGDIGRLPVRTAGQVIYPHGRIRGLYYAEELRGLPIRKLYAGWTATDWIRPFDGYVHSLYRAKETPGSPLYLAAKILLNSLYGILGQAGNASGLTTVRRGCKAEGVMVAPGVVAYSYETKAPKRANVIWAGMITSRVRAKLRETLELCQDRILYCDTDGVFLRGLEGPVPPGPRTGLGSWRLKETVEKVEVIAPKVYGYKVAAGWTWRAKGVRPQFAELFARTGRARWRAPVPILQGALRGETAGSWRIMERAVAQAYQGRRILASGRTVPWQIPRDLPGMEFARRVQAKRNERGKGVLTWGPRRGKVGGIRGQRAPE